MAISLQHTTVMIHTVDAGNFEELILKSEVPVLLTFGASWCGPCKAFQPVLEDIASEFEQPVRVGKVDIDNHAEIAKQLNVWAIPTMLQLIDGKELGQLKKIQLKRTIVRMPEPHLP